MQQYYIKQGRRYIPVDPPPEWQGFPCDGLWLVQTKEHGKSSSCISQIGEVPRVFPYASMMVTREELASFLHKKHEEHVKNTAIYDKDHKLTGWTEPSYYEAAKEILLFLSQQDPSIKNIEF